MAPAWLIAAAVLVYAVAKSLDGLARKLAPWGIEVAGWVNDIAGQSEEILELAAAVMILQAVGLAVAGPRTGNGPPAEGRP